MKRNLIIIVIAVAVLAVALVLWAVHSVPPDEPGTPSESSSGSSASSTPSSSSAVAVTTAPATQTAVPSASVPTIAAGEYVGTIYTRSELDAMDNSRQSFWPDSTDNKRPYGVTAMQRTYKEHNTYFIGNDNSLVYFTFNCDDEPLAKDSEGNTVPNTAVILDLLHYQQIQATFFVTGRFCRTHPELVQRIINEGHILGNYGLSSVELPGLSTEEMTAQIMDLHTYVLQEFDYTMKYFRPYGGAYSPRTFALANSLGYTTILYSVAYPDKDNTSRINADQAMEKLTAQFHKGAVFRLHTASSVSVSILKDLIDTLREGYYRISLFQP